jgi:hypothetical protein
MPLSTSNSERPWYRYLLALAVFFASLLVFDRALFKVFSWVESAAYRTYDLPAKLDALPDKAGYKILILGTSRTFEAIHPALILRDTNVRSYKEAFVGKGPRYFYHFYQLYRQRVGIPRMVVYGVDYFIFNVKSLHWMLNRFGLQAEYNPGPSRLLANKADYTDKFIVQLLQQLQNRLFPSGLPDPEKNVADMEAYVGSSESRVTTTGKPPKFQKAPFFNFPGVEGEYLVKLLDQLKVDGVTVLLIGLPDAIGTFETNFRQRRFVFRIEYLIQNYPNCFFFNYNKPDVFPLDRTDFFMNGGYGEPNSHMSQVGAEFLARRLNADIRELLNRNPGQ